MKATMRGANFNRIISAVKAFTSANEARPANTMIQLHINKEALTVSAYGVDGYRAAKESGTIYSADGDFRVLIFAPPIKAPTEAVVEIEDDGEYAYITYGDIRFRYKQPEGKPFDVQDFFEKEMVKERRQVGLNVNYLLDAAKSIKAAGRTIRQSVVIEFGGPADPVIIRADHENPRVVLPVRLRADQ